MVNVVAAVVGEQVAAFELGIASQLFGLDRTDDGLGRSDFRLISAEPGRVRSSSGFDVVVVHGLDRLDDAQLVVVPAWPQLERPAPPRLLDALRAAEARGVRFFSICSGAFLLAAAGLLDGREATTHWQFTDRLQRFRPQVTVRHDVLYVDDGRVLTSAGAAAGIDAGLHLIRELDGPTTASALARRMVVAAHRSGGQAQFVEAPIAAASPGDDGLAELLDWVQVHLDEPLPVAVLAGRLAVSPRTFARRFRAATGTTPHRWILDQRLRRAEAFLESTDLTVEAIAGRCGFGRADSMRHQFTAHRGVGPAAYRRMFGTGSG